MVPVGISAPWNNSQQFHEIELVPMGVSGSHPSCLLAPAHACFTPACAFCAHWHPPSPFVPACALDIRHYY